MTRRTGLFDGRGLGYMLVFGLLLGGATNGFGQAPPPPPPRPEGTATNTSFGDAQFPGKCYGQATVVPNKGFQVDSVYFEIGDYGGPGGAFRPLGGLNSSFGVLQPGGGNVWKTTFAGRTAGNKIPVRMTAKWRPVGQVAPVTETVEIVEITIK